MSLAEGQWWRTSFHTEQWNSPLQISVKVKSSEGCSEGAAADGTCIFGLKLYGSQQGPPTPGDNEQSDEGSHYTGEEYRLLVPACSLQGSMGRYHIGLRGWDGTNQIELRADEVRFPLSQPVCPTLGNLSLGRNIPMPRHSHGATLLHDTMMVFGGQMNSTASDETGPQSADAISTPATDELWVCLIPLAHHQPTCFCLLWVRPTAALPLD